MSMEAVSVAVSIMAVRSRADSAERIARQIRRDCPRRSVPVHYDTTGNPWNGWRGAWDAAGGTGATHRVVLQDDVLLCRDFVATMVALAKARPDDPVSGFLPRKCVETAHAKGLRWARTRRFLWCQCLMMPAEMGEEALRWIDAREGERGEEWSHHDDSRLGAYFKAETDGVYVTVPNVVEHVGDEMGSVLGHHGSPAMRRARHWVGDEESGLQYDWSDLEFVKE